MKTHAEQFEGALRTWLDASTKAYGAKVDISVGIVTINFKDGSKLDFTDPRSFKPGEQVE